MVCDDLTEHAAYLKLYLFIWKFLMPRKMRPSQCSSTFPSSAEWEMSEKADPPQG